VTGPEFDRETLDIQTLSTEFERRRQKALAVERTAGGPVDREPAPLGFIIRDLPRQETIDRFFFEVFHPQSTDQDIERPPDNPSAA
jgi:hypothetical protein